VFSLVRPHDTTRHAIEEMGTYRMMWRAGAGRVQLLPTHTWYMYSSWPHDITTLSRPQLGSYTPYCNKDTKRRLREQSTLSSQQGEEEEEEGDTLVE
jgi:hypothetical protein